MKKLLILGLIVMLCLAPVVLADSKLRIKNLKAYVDGDKDSGVSESGGTIDDVKPESKVKLKFDVENLYTSTENIEIEDIEVEGVIKDIDDGDDIDDDAKEFDLDATDDKGVMLEFDVPLLVDEKSYKLEITVKGEAKVNNTIISHSLNTTLSVKVEKEKHLLQFYRKILNPESVSCGKSTELELGIINLGSNDEEDISLTVSNPDLELSQKSLFTLDEGDDPDDVRILKRFRITPSEVLSAGTYPISVQAVYDDGDGTLSEIMDFTVTKCEVPKEEEPTQKEETVEVKTTTTELTAEQLLAQAQAEARAQPPITVTKPEEAKSSFLEDYGIALVVLLYIVVIAVGILVFAAVLKRRR